MSKSKNAKRQGEVPTQHDNSLEGGVEVHFVTGRTALPELAADCIESVEETKAEARTETLYNNLEYLRHRLRETAHFIDNFDARTNNSPHQVENIWQRMARRILAEVEVVCEQASTINNQGLRNRVLLVMAGIKRHLDRLAINCDVRGLYLDTGRYTDGIHLQAHAAAHREFHVVLGRVADAVHAETLGAKQHSRFVRDYRRWATQSDVSENVSGLLFLDCIDCLDADLADLQDLADSGESLTAVERSNLIQEMTDWRKECRRRREEATSMNDAAAVTALTLAENLLHYFGHGPRGPEEYLSRRSIRDEIAHVRGKLRELVAATTAKYCITEAQPPEPPHAASPAEAPPLTTPEAVAAFDYYCAQRTARAVPVAEVLTHLARKGHPMSDTNYYSHIIPQLESRGLKKVGKRKGHYMPEAARPQHRA